MSLEGVARVLGDSGARAGGPLLVCMGGLHGNEPCGVLALERVFETLNRDRSALVGRVVGLSGNRGALAVDQRFLDEDLNRMWFPKALAGGRDAGPRGIEGPRERAELLEIANELELLLSAPTGTASFLDVHSTSGGGSAFTSLDDTLANRRIAFDIPVPHVLGLEEELAGTLVSYLNDRGVPAIGFESGQHADPGSVDRAEAAIWIAMEATGVLERGRRDEVRRSRRLLEEQYTRALDVVEVLHRHAVEPEDGFVMAPGFGNFQPVREGQLLAHDRSGEVRSPMDGRILMPLYQGQGEDGFFVVRPVKHIWLTVSKALRRVRADAFLHWLPGVERSAAGRSTFVVDLGRARILALQVFHLLGYKRVGRSEGQLIMRRRDERAD